MIVNQHQFAILNFYGLADGSANLTQDFNINDLKGKILQIKSIHTRIYAGGDDYIELIDFDNAAGTINANSIYKVQPGSSKIRLEGLEDYAQGLKIKGYINDTPIRFLQTTTNIGFPLENDWNDINIKFPSPLVDINFICEALVWQNWKIPQQVPPYIKIILETYLLDSNTTEKLGVLRR